ncbi:MAG: 30S ribosome-binding factor RbfA [Cryomorphaceae bacterium]|nr:30S ribosome-binding factor RbfA [Cryomorphaceae bacterium]
MDNTRLTRLNQLMIESLGHIFQRFSQTHFQGILVSVTKVRVSPDLSVGNVYLSIFPSSNADKVIEAIGQQQGFIKRELGNTIGKQIRKMPELRYYVDDSLDYEDNIDRLLRGEGDNPLK